MIAAASEKTHLEKTMNWFGVYPTISKGSRTSLQVIYYGAKNIRNPNHYLTEHMYCNKQTNYNRRL
jgi:hypothetical protein